MDQLFLLPVINLSPEIPDIDIDYIGASRIIEIPQMLLKPLSGKYDSLILYHIPEKCKLFSRQGNLFSAP